MTGRAAQLAETVRMVVLDVDGVLTDGSVFYGGTDQSEIKAFNVRTCSERTAIPAEPSPANSAAQR